jgi:hypothetical protein
MMFISSCTLLRVSNVPTYTYQYKCVNCNLSDSVLYSNVLYYPGDTVTVIPSNNKILITDISLTKY